MDDELILVGSEKAEGLSEDDYLERKHWSLVAKSFLEHKSFMELECKSRWCKYEALLKRGLLPKNAASRERLQKYRSYCGANDAFFRAVLSMQGFGFAPRNTSTPLPDPFRGDQPPSRFFERCDAVLHSVMREWSAEGKVERDESFAPLIAAIERLLPVTDVSTAYKYNVVIPGCGLGRLAAELSSRGYNTQMNEYSVFMLLANNFMSNGATQRNAFTLFPWLRTRNNLITTADVVKGIKVPDATCAQVISRGPYASVYREPTKEEFAAGRLPRFSLRAGDFVELYGTPDNVGKWDGVVTCWFIDAVHDVVELMTVIHAILRPGGVWVNLGPLLYHWLTDQEGTGDDRYRHSVALSWEDIRLIMDTKFPDLQFVVDEWKDATYAARPHSMQKMSYRSALVLQADANDIERVGNGGRNTACHTPDGRLE